MGTGVGDPRCACILLLSHTSNISTPSLPGTQTFHPLPQSTNENEGGASVSSLAASGHG